MIAEPRVVSVRKRTRDVRRRTNQKRPMASATNAAMIRQSTTMLTDRGFYRLRRVKALQITELSGPDSALTEVDIPEPEASHMLTPGSGVVIDVKVAGVSFPEVLQTRGEY